MPEADIDYHVAPVATPVVAVPQRTAQTTTL
jgi:hypothetical protein